MSSDRTNGSGVSFPAADALIDLGNLLLSPGRVMSVGDDDVGGFDEGPLEIIVSLLSQTTEAGLAAAGMDFGNNPGVGSEVPCSGEAIDGADLSFDDDGEDVTHTWKGLQQLHIRGELDAFQDAIFEHGDLFHGGVEEIEFLFQAAAGFRREFLEGSIEPGSTFSDEDIAVFGGVESVLGEGGVNAVLKSGTRLTECHASAMECALVADLSRRQPDGGEAAEVDQGGKAFGIKFIGLVDIAHYDLSFGGVSQKGDATCLLDLVDDPVVIANGFEGNRGSIRVVGKEFPDGTWVVIDPGLFSG